MSFGWSVGDLVNAVSILVQVAEAVKDVQGASEAYSLDSLFFKSIAVTLEALTQSPDKINGLEEHIDEIYRAVEQFREWFEKRVGVALSPITTSNPTTTKRLKRVISSALARVEYALVVSKEVTRFRQKVSSSLQVVQTNLQLNALIQLTSFGQHKSSLTVDVVANIEKLNQTLLQTYYARIESHENSNRTRKILAWLNHLSVDDKLNDTSQSMLAGSCTWILSKPGIPPLLDPDLMQVPKGWLWWVSGIPGSGKTNVATSLIQKLKADRFIAYFFCETQKPESLDVVAILRTWVWQLLQKIPEKVKEVATYFERGDQPSRTNMRACLQTFISADERPLFILDGLDEMDYDGRETFYTSIAGLNGLCDILVLSRELPDIFDGLSQAANDTERALYHLRIVENDTKNDIQNFIHREVDRLNLSSTGDQQLVRRALAEKAKGMFVWVELILKHLKQRKRFFREQIVDQLDSLPDSLGELYARILQRLFEQRDTRAQTTLLFKWIACSEQPLKLTELSSVLNIKENETQPRNFSLLEPSDLEQALFYCCGPIIRVIEDEPNKSKVTLIHASAKEFLLDQSRSSESYGSLLVSAQQGHSFLASSCLTYLCYNNIPFAPFRDDDDAYLLFTDYSCGRKIQKRFDQYLERYPLLEYAALNWWKHMLILDQPEPLPAFIRFFSCSHLSVKWLQILLGLCKESPVHLSLIQCIINLRPFVDSKHEAAFSAWIKRLIGPSEESMRWKLFIAAGDANEFLPELHVAAFFDFTETIIDLVGKGVDVDLRTFRGQTPLAMAARGNALESAKLLIRYGADPNTLGWANSTPIFWAFFVDTERRWLPALPRPFHVGKFLLESCNADPHKPIFTAGWEHETPLHRLCILPENEYSIELVRLIAQRGPKEELGPFPKLKTPLHTAARVGNVTIVKILLENGVSADVACDRGLISPLLWLCEKSDPNLHIVRALIQKGANIHAIDPEEGRTALHFATRSLHATLAEILLESGADVNATSFNGDLPIHEAIYNNNLDVVKVFITYGSPLSKKDSSGRTPLKIATDHANQELSSVLIAAGGKIEQEDNESKMKNGPQTPGDQFEVFWILQNKCTQSPMPSWLVLRILDMAEYWVKVEVKRAESVRVEQRKNPNGMVYLMTDPLPGRMKGPVRAIQFTTFSHDQGWSDYTQSHGSYHNTWTWFKAVVEENDGTRIPIEGEDGLLCKNLHARWSTKEHRVAFGEGSTRRKRDWVEKIHRGSRVGILAEASFPGWVNYVEGAQIEIILVLLKGSYPHLRLLSPGRNHVPRRSMVDMSRQLLFTCQPLSEVVLH